jgi:hypothetical protein
MSTQTLFMGKLPATPENVKLKFSDFANTTVMETPPTDFGHDAMVTEWGMLGNDQAGDCYVCGITHADMLWLAEAGIAADFSTKTAIGYYQELTKHFNGVAYDPSRTDPNTGENPTDTGINLSLALPLWQQIGLPDDAGNRHKIGAYVKLHIDPDELWYATRYFDGVILGVEMSQEWMEGFQAGNYVWDAVDDPNIIGGHCITSVAWRNNNPVVVSWGKEVVLTRAGFSQMADEAYAVLSVDKLINGMTLEGFNITKLQNAIKQLPRL